LITFSLPKTYESEAVIQLGGVYDQKVYDTVEAKSILLSAAVLDPVRLKYYPKLSHREFADAFDVELVSGEVGLRQLIVAPQLKVKFKAGDAIESKDVLSEAIASFFGYANERFDEIKQPVFLEYNETLRLAELDYNTSMKNIDYEIAQRNLAIESLEKDAAEMEERIKSIESGELSTESLSKATLLRTILSDLEGRLNNEKNSKIFLERSKMEERVSYERSVKNAKVSFDAQMAVVREFKVVSSPQVPKSYVYPKVALNLELSVIAGLLFSCVFVLVRHGRGK
jgi:LPS O-antigen subunit length determinant protein (WzzB/FepE family)